MLEAISKNGKKVYLSFNPDCDENEGGWFVEVYFNQYGDYQDYFCIHPEDCDCKNQDEVDECAKRYISEIEYYFKVEKNKLKFFDTEYLNTEQTLQPVAVEENLYYTVYEKSGKNYVFSSFFAVMQFLKDGIDSYMKSFDTEAEMNDFLDNF